MGEIREETINDYYCLRCSIRATVWKINYELQNYPNSYDNYEKKALEMQIEFLENYKATHRVLDEDEFKPEFQKFIIGLATFAFQWSGLKVLLNEDLQ